MREVKHLIFNKRFRTVFFMFIGFFAQFWWMGKTKRFLTKDKINQKYQAIYTAQATKFTETAVELGGLIIKLGQFASTRVDMLPKAFTDILAELQDSVSPVKSELIVETIETELSKPINTLFTDFNRTPVAAASLGQVHRATLNNGEEVAVKVMRPGIKELVTVDLATVRVLIAFAKRFTKVSKFVDLDDIYTEFDEVITEEIDYQNEIRNMEQFRNEFAEFPGVAIPQVHKEYATSKVLVMEYIDGVKINEVDKLDGTKVNKKKLASILYISYLKQLLEDGFFHADPHPGNLLVKSDGTLVYIDFGMVGRISTEMKENMVKLALAIYMKDAGGIANAFDDLGFLRKQADKTALTKNIKLILSGFTGDSFSIKTFQNEEMLEELRQFLYQQPFQIPSQTTFLGKAIISVFSLCRFLDEDFDLVAMTKPYVEDMVKLDTNNPAKDAVIDQVKNTVAAIIPSFRKIVQLVDQFESGEMRIAPSLLFEKNLSENQQNQTRRIVLALFGTGLLISGATLVGSYQEAGLVMMISGGLFTLMQALRTGRGGSRPRRRHPFMHPKR